MSRDVKFSMNTGPGGGQDIIRDMAEPLVKASAEAVAERARNISGSLTSKPISIKVDTHLGLPNKRGGKRAYAVVEADGIMDEHEDYIAYTAVQKSKDAGRV